MRGAAITWPSASVRSSISRRRRRGYEGTGFPEREVEEVRPVPPGDLQDVAKAVGGDERGLRPLARQERVDNDRASVREEPDRLRIDCLGCLQNAALERRGRAVHLVRDEPGDPPAVVELVPHEIGERAPPRPSRSAFERCLRCECLAALKRRARTPVGRGRAVHLMRDEARRRARRARRARTPRDR